MFVHTHLSVGPLLPRQSKTIEFPYSDLTITELASSCGCSDPTDDKDKQKVTVKVTAGDIPVHLMHKESLISTPFVLVKYHLGDPTKIQEVKLTITLTRSNPNFYKKS